MTRARVSRRRERVTEVVGISRESWEAAGRDALADVARTVSGLRAAEVVGQDLVVEDGAVTGFRVRLAIAFDPDDGARSDHRGDRRDDRRTTDA